MSTLADELVGADFDDLQRAFGLTSFACSSTDDNRRRPSCLSRFPYPLVAGSQRSLCKTASRPSFEKRSLTRTTPGSFSFPTLLNSAHAVPQVLSSLQEGSQDVKEALPLPPSSHPRHSPQALLLPRSFQRQGSCFATPRSCYLPYDCMQIETQVQYPLSGLDLTSFVPPPLFDPRTPPPSGPPKGHVYDLYGVTNHYGNLSSGH